MELTRSIPSPDTLARLSGFASRALHWLWRSQRRPRTLFVRETVLLGDRRFVAVVEFERRRFLVGTGPSAVTLLAELPGQPQVPAEECRNAGERK